MKGRIDRIDECASGEIAVIDFKTGKAKTQDDADESLQLSVYALAAQNALGSCRVVAGLHQSGKRNRDRIAAHAEAIVARRKKKCEPIAAKIAAGEFDPRPSGALRPVFLSTASARRRKSRCRVPPPAAPRK